jgi:aminopeptidase N
MYRFFIFVLLLLKSLIFYGQSNDQKSNDIDFEILHTELKIKPIWQNQTLEGTAIITVKPYFYKKELIKLDAKGFIIDIIKLNSQKVDFEYDKEQITIKFNKFYTSADTLKLEINYIAQPNLLKSSGSDAISSDKGLYFINPLNDVEGLQRQLWTQGETQANSCWFPTIDSPNQKHKQDIFLTVEKNQTSLSNGLLIKTKENQDGTKTDHWQQKLPHSVYLTMIAVGDFKKVRDSTSKNLEVSYYVEPQFDKYAYNIFGRTPEMIKYFETILGYKFRWQKYAQIPVRKYVSGAMENTTATIHSKTLYKNTRQLLDGNDDGVIAHELFHHWFGDLVTCESWSQLPLNESFANYSEFLWATYKYGKAEGDNLYLTALQDYLYEATQKQVPLIRFNYLTREDMFDAHSYQKGGRVLHQLRLEVGDEAFFKALNYYLQKNEFQTSEIQDLRLAFEKTTGRDLKWFFDQWFLKAGHPRLKITHKVKKNSLTISVNQIVDSKNANIYYLKMPLIIYSGNKKTEKEIIIDKADSTYSFSIEGNYSTLVMNPDGYFLGSIDHQNSEEELLEQFKLSTQVNARTNALATLTLTEDGEQEIKNQPLQKAKIRELVLLALKDDFWKIRQMAVQKLFNYDGDGFLEVEKALQNIIKNDTKSNVRADAILAVKNFLNPQNDVLFRQALNDSSYLVVAAALEALFANNVEDADALALKFKNETDINIFAALGNYYATKGDAANYEWFIKNLTNMEGYEIYQNVSIFGSYLYTANDEIKNKAMPFLKNMAQNENEWFVRISAAQILIMLSEENKNAKNALIEVMANEKDERILNFYKQYKN